MRPVHPAPSTGPLIIGAKLRSSRIAQGLTIAQLAEAVGLTKGFISRVERDETSPSVSTLVTICQVLSLPIGALFEAPETEVVGLKDAPLINMGGTGAVERLLTSRPESRVQLLRSVLSPGASGGDVLYTVNCDIEAAHVLRGEITIVLTREEILLSEGDSLTLAGREPHSWRNTSSGTSEIVWTLVPAACRHGAAPSGRPPGAGGRPSYPKHGLHRTARVQLRPPRAHLVADRCSATRQLWRPACSRRA